MGKYYYLFNYFKIRKETVHQHLELSESSKGNFDEKPKSQTLPDRIKN